MVGERCMVVGFLKEWSVTKIGGVLRHPRHPGCQNDSNTRIVRADPSRHIKASHLTGEFNVGEQYLDLLAGPEYCLSFFAATRLQHAIAALPEIVTNGEADENLVL